MKVKKRILWVVNICLIMTAMLIPVLADEIITVNMELERYTSFSYPCAGSEYVRGPENTYYFAIHYNGNGEVVQGDVVREADDFVFMTVYPDGDYEEFDVPPLTEEQVKAFDEKYNPDYIRQREEAEKKEREKRANKRLVSLIEEGLVDVASGENYWVYLYQQPDEQVFRKLSGNFSILTYANTFENPYGDFDAVSFRNHIVKQLEKIDLACPVKISIAPYDCEESREGWMKYEQFAEKGNEYGLHIGLFHNDEVSLKEQFDIQFEKYLNETTR